MKSRSIGFLSSCQLLMLGIKLACFYAHQPLSWLIVLWPLETLVGVAVLFWVVVGLIVRRLT